MELIKPSIKFLWMTENPLQMIELAGRTCYKSEDKITKDSCKSFVEMLIKNGHHAMIEHAELSYRVICDRGVTHEIVRHRLFSYAQESTRYCNYANADNIQFIIPCWLPQLKDLEIIESSMDFNYYVKTFRYMCIETLFWVHTMGIAELKYSVAIKTLKWSPQKARSVLPNSLKTEIVIKGNFRQWRHFFKMRCSTKAHPQMQEIAYMILEDIQTRVQILFDEFTQ